MKKKILIGIASLVTLAALITIAIPFILDINYLKPKLKALVEKQLNTQIDIGELKLSRFPGLGLEMTHVKILNPPHFENDSLFETDQIKIHFGAIKSLFGSPKIKLTLLHPKIQISRNEQHELNILKLQKEKKDAPPPQERPKSLRDLFPNGWLGSVLVRSSYECIITDGTITFNHGDGTSDEFSKINLHIGPWGLTDAVALKLSAEAHSFNMKGIKFSGLFISDTQIENPFLSENKWTFESHFNLDTFIIEAPGYTKKSTDPLSIKLSGTIHRDSQLTFESNLDIKSQDVDATGHARGTLRPWILQSGSGDVDIHHLDQDFPQILTSWLQAHSIDLEGKSSVSAQTKFSFEDQKLTALSIANASIDLGHAKLQYKDQLIKNEQVPFRLKGSFTSEIPGENKPIALKVSDGILIYDTFEAKFLGTLDISEKMALDLNLSSNLFSTDLFSPFLSKLPFQFQGKAQIHEIHILGNPKEIDSLEIQGKSSIQNGRLTLAPELLRSKEWILDGPMSISADQEFKWANHKLIFLDLNAEADLTDTTIQKGKLFIKPAQTKLKIDSVLSLKNDVLTASKLAMTFHTLTLSSSAKITNLSTPQTRTTTLKLDSNSFQLSDWNQFFPSIEKKFTGEAQFKNIEVVWPHENFKDLKLNGKIELKQIQGEIPKNLIQTKSLSLQGPFTIDLNTQLEYAKQNFNTLLMKGKMDLSKMEVKYHDILHKNANIPFTIELNVDSKANRLSVNPIKLTLQNFVIETTGFADHISKKPDFNLEFQTSSFSMNELSQFLPVLKKNGLAGQMRLNGKIKGLVTDPTQPLWVEFQLRSPALEYVPDEAPPKSVQMQGAHKSTTEAYVSSTLKEGSSGQRSKWAFFGGALKRLNLSGKIEATKATYKTFKFWNILSEVNLKNQILNAAPTQFQFYDGQFSSATQIDFSKTEPQTHFQISLDHMNMEKFLTSQKSALAEKFSGTVSLDLMASMTGFSGPKIKDSLQGKGKFISQDGHFKIFNLTEAIQGIPILSKIAPNIDLSDRYSKLQTTLIIKNQKLVTPDIRLQATNHLLTCEGSLGFDGSLDYKGEYYLSETADIKKQIPFSVTGTISKPIPLPDMGKVLQNTVQGVFDQILTPTKEEKTEDKAPSTQEPKSKNILEDIIKNTLP